MGSGTALGYSLGATDEGNPNYPRPDVRHLFFHFRSFPAISAIVTKNYNPFDDDVHQ
jgi:hypothetical protein